MYPFPIRRAGGKGADDGARRREKLASELTRRSRSRLCRITERGLGGATATETEKERTAAALRGLHCSLARGDNLLSLFVGPVASLVRSFSIFHLGSLSPSFPLSVSVSSVRVRAHGKANPAINFHSRGGSDERETTSSIPILPDIAVGGRGRETRREGQRGFSRVTGRKSGAAQRRLESQPDMIHFVSKLVCV